MMEKITFHDFKAWKILKWKIFRLWFDEKECLVNVLLKPSVALKYQSI